VYESSAQWQVLNSQKHPTPTSLQSLSPKQSPKNSVVLVVVVVIVVVVVVVVGGPFVVVVEVDVGSVTQAHVPA
jgi:t-SNARE complex subunit (syntaxin)